MPIRTKISRGQGRSGLLARRADDRAELVQALDAHAGLIIGSAARVLGSLTDAEDVAQDVAEKLLKTPPKGVRSWPAYLKAIAVNRALDYQRRGSERTVLDPPQSPGDPESDLYDAQCADILRAAIGRLPQRDRQLFSLFYFADLTHGDIAERMNMTANAVGVALHRVRARLTSDVGALLDQQKELLTNEFHG